LVCRAQRDTYHDSFKIAGDIAHAFEVPAPAAAQSMCGKDNADRHNDPAITAEKRDQFGFQVRMAIVLCQGFDMFCCSDMSRS